MSKRVREIAGKFGLALAAVAVALGIGECSVRVFGLAPEIAFLSEGRYRLSTNPLIAYEPIPELSFQGERAEQTQEVPAQEDLPDTDQFKDARRINHMNFDYRGSSNRMGYRDRDHEIAKPPGTYRIVVIGDSVAAGLFIQQFENTFPARLEAKLRAAGANVEVISLAVSGYNTQQEVATLEERGLQFSPDLVLVVYCHNDRWQANGDLLKKLIDKETHHKGISEATAGFLVRYSHLFRLIWFRLFQKHKADLPAKYAALDQDTVDQYLARLGELSRQRGFRTLLAVFPYLRRLDQPAKYKYTKEHQTLARIASEQGFVHVDLLETFRACERDSGERVFIDGWHPTSIGHECAAAAVAGAIVQILPNRAD